VFVFGCYVARSIVVFMCVFLSCPCCRSSLFVSSQSCVCVFSSVFIYIYIYIVLLFLFCYTMFCFVPMFILPWFVVLLIRILKIKFFINNGFIIKQIQFIYYKHNNEETQHVLL
jgi:hypothetical protein